VLLALGEQLSPYFLRNMGTVRRRAQEIGESRVQIVNLSESKFFRFGPVDVVGYGSCSPTGGKPRLIASSVPTWRGVGEAATIFATASRRFDWTKTVTYLERIDSDALARRFGWLTDHVRAEMPDDMRERVSRFAARSRRRGLGC
jgi:predicted transcriptional regulator of viral defense system